MKVSSFVLPLAGALSLVSAAASAQVWIASGESNSDRFEVDVSHVTRTGDVAESWVRRTPSRPQRDERTGKLYASELIKRYDDCAAHRFAFGDYMRRDARGETVSSGSVATGWRDAAPGSVAEAGLKLACAVSHPPDAKPLLADIAAGAWKDAGAAADGAYKLSFKSDDFVTLQKGVVLTFTRSDYAKPTWIDGFAVTNVVSAAAVDCARRESAGLGADMYVSPKLRVQAWRAAKDKITFEAVPPGSFLFRQIDLVCAGADKAPAARDGAADAGSLASGTAWGVDKGYLVTASHVITGARKIAVYDNGQLVGSAAVVADDPSNDVAVLKFKPKSPGKLPILLIAPKPPVLGRRVITLGYPEPDNLGQHIKVTSGEISSTAGYQDDPRFLQVSIPFQPGNSGGPVIAPDGTVVGIAQSKLLRFGEEESDEPAPEMVNYAVKTSYLRPLLEDLPDLGNYVVVRPTAGADDLIAQARRAVFMLIVAH